MFQSLMPSLGRGLLLAALASFSPIAGALPQSASGFSGLEGFLSPSSPGPIVASIKVDAPTVSPFLVHATLPLPPNVFSGSGPITPLVLLDAKGNPVTTQIEMVTRHPMDGAGASMVELLARVDAPAKGQGSLNFFVQRHDSPRMTAPANPSVADFLAAPANLPPQVKSLLSNPGQIYLAATDVFDNIYLLDLVQDPSYDQGARRTERFGSVQAEFRHHGLLRPILPKTGPQGTLSHLFGVHAYFRITAGDPVVELDLRIHNGADGSSQSNEAMGALYFKELTLLVPKGWVPIQRHANPTLGTAGGLGPFMALPLVEARPDGKPHVMPKQGQMQRRLVLAQNLDLDRAKSHLASEGLGFAIPGPGPKKTPFFWSWWNPVTPHYFPQGHLLPRLEQVLPANLNANLSTEYQELSQHLELGTGGGIYPIWSGELGWAHPYGIAYGGMTGGDGIDLFWGLRTLVAASIDGYRRLEVLHRMDTDRMPNALYAQDGTPSAVEDWVIKSPNGDYVPFYFYMKPTGTNDPFGFTTAPTFQADYVKNNGLEPDYEATLFGYENIDVQHLVRYTGPAKALAWIGNDSLAKDDIELQAEMVNMGYHMYENSAYHHVQGTGMLADRQFVDAHPAVGFPFGRGEGWGMDTMTAAYMFADADWRKTKLGWFQDISDLINDGQAACSGFIQATVYGKLLEGKFRVRQVIESSIVQNAMLGVRNNVLKGKDPVRFYLLGDSLNASLRALIRPEAWDPAKTAPYSQLAVAPKDETLPPYCGPPPAGGQSTYTDAYQQWSSLAYGMELTGDPAFLNYAEKMLGQPLTTIILDPSLSNLGNRAALNALVEFILAAI